MSIKKWCIGLAFSLIFMNLSSAPPAKNLQLDLEVLAEARCKMARELFDEAWILWKRKGETPGGVYVTSIYLLQANIERTEDPASRIAAYQQHLDRMETMRAVVIRLRAMGYANKFHFKAVECFSLEARYWLVREKVRLAKVPAKVARR